MVPVARLLEPIVAPLSAEITWTENDSSVGSHAAPETWIEIVALESPLWITTVPSVTPV
jgi:hypothetical protein